MIKYKLHDNKELGSPLTRGQMLALVLYTGCECNYDLCGQQRNGNYDKWKWFDYCLYEGICALQLREAGSSFPVYSGICNVQMNHKCMKRGYFTTYVSTSWRKEVALTFMNGQGMVIEFDKEYKDTNSIWCNVSWISKFPDECEILFARSTGIFNGWE
eukprot:266026_1